MKWPMVWSVVRWGLGFGMGYLACAHPMTPAAMVSVLVLVWSLTDKWQTHQRLRRIDNPFRLRTRDGQQG